MATRRNKRRQHRSTQGREASSRRKESYGRLGQPKPAPVPPLAAVERWFIATTRPRGEVWVRRRRGAGPAPGANAAVREIEAAGFTAYRPVEQVTVVGRGRAVDVRRNLFPRFVLVDLDETEADGVTPKWYRFRDMVLVDGLMRSRETLQPIPLRAGELDVSREAVVKAAEAPPSPWRVGQQVSPTQGFFAGRVGVIERLDEASGRTRVSIDVFGRKTPVELHVDSLEELDNCST